jgi:hypothetical protein
VRPEPPWVSKANGASPQTPRTNFGILLAVQRTLVEELLLVDERNEQLIEGRLVLAECDRGLSGIVPVPVRRTRRRRLVSCNSVGLT